MLKFKKSLKRSCFLSEVSAKKSLNQRCQDFFPKVSVKKCKRLFIVNIIARKEM